MPKRFARRVRAPLVAALSMLAVWARRAARLLAVDGLPAIDDHEHQALRNQVKFTNDLFESVPVALALRDREGHYLFVNRTWEQYFGSRREDVVGNSPRERVSAEEAGRVLALDRAALDRGIGGVELSESDHRGRRYTQTRTVMADEHGEVIGVLIASLDTTEQHATNQRLRDQMALTEAIVAQIPGAIFTKDAQGRFTMVNRGWCEMSGVSAERALGHTVHDIYPPELARRFAGEDEKLIALGAAAAPIEAEHSGPRPGQWRIVRKAVLSREDGTITGLVATSTDISELKRIQGQLADRAKFEADLVDALPIAVALRDAEGRFVQVNRTWERYFDIPRSDAIGRRFEELPGWQDNPELAQTAIRANELDRELLARGPDAPPVLFEESRLGRSYLLGRQIFTDSAGQVAGLLATGIDTTDLRATEQALANEQRRLDLVVRASRVGTLDWDGVTRSVYYSPRLKEMLGFAPDADTSAWPDVFDGFVHPEDKERVRRVFRQHILGTGPEGKSERHPLIEYRMRRADGSYVWVETQGISVRDARGFCLRFTASYTDITERRAQEEALRASVRLREEVERMSRHDLKTPLNSVIAVSRLLREGGKLSREDEDLLSIVERAGYRILSMVNLSLDLYRMEQGSYQFHPQAVDLADVARKVAADLEGQAASKNVALRLRQSGRSLARAEELLCYSMLANLVKNAIEAAREDEIVSVTVDGAGETVNVHVHNRGEVPHAVRSRFFDKYASSGKSAGLGLGTYSARLMAQVQEGDITLHSDASAGTTVSVRLTAARALATSPDAKAPAPATGTRAERLPELPALRVLVVDDDEFNRLVLRRYLPSPPLSIAMAVNGRAALDAARKDWPDVVLLDLEMPVMDGYEAAARLRALEREGRAPLKIVAISSNDEDAIVQRALAAGCDHYLVKPAPRETLFRLLAGEAVSPAHPGAAQGPVGADAPSSIQLDARLADKVPAFLASRRELLDTACAAAQGGDRETLRRLAHRLAGSLALYGLHWAAVRTRAVESAAAAGALDELAARLAEVRAHLDTVRFTYAEDSAESL